MELAIYAHPWDLRALAAHGGLVRLRDLGFTEVALAVSYHAGRWLTPWQGDSMVRFLEDGTVHFRPRGDYGQLTPRLSQEVPVSGPSPLEALCEDAAKVGMKTRAWVVCTHNTRLGERHPECSVENAFGDRYPYALCPANPQVQQYVHTMAEDLAAQPGLHTIELEALGWMGHRHNSHHDKNSFASDAYTDLLLSTCFCTACSATAAALKYQQDPVGAAAVERWRQGFADALRRHFADGDCMQPPPAKLDKEALLQKLRTEFGPEVMVLLGHRFMTSMLNVARLSPLRQRGVRLAVQTNYDSLRGGAALPLAGLGGMVDETVLTTYGESADGVAAAMPSLLAARGQDTRPPLAEARWPKLRLALHPRQPQYRSDDDLRKVRDLGAQHAVSSLSIYHLGLLPWRTLERVAAAFR